MNIILLSGGSGKRLWPLSNNVRSKQFLKIFRKTDGTKESINGEEQRVTVFANKEQIADYVATEPEEKVLIIPKSIISNDVLSIEINLPDATPGNKDKRERALWIKQIVIREAELLQ